MSRFKHSKEEQELNTVLAHQKKQLDSIEVPKIDESRIAESEELLRSLGYALPTAQSSAAPAQKETITVGSWDKLVSEAVSDVGEGHTLEELFSEEELRSNEAYIKALAEEFDSLHRLDLIDYSICAIAGILSGALDILLTGIPKKTHTGLKAGPLSDYIRRQFEKKYPVAEMDKLAAMPISKVPYDAQDNRHTIERVEGLSAYYHRLLSLGHDPLLGFAVGVFDIMTGRMTTIDKTGKLVSQVMENYSDRVETNVFQALAKQFLHLKTDINTSMGLPAPLMGLFDLLQFGSIGEENQTVAQIVQGMFFEGYDFIHFCSASIPVMVTEVIVRICYAVRMLRSGHSVKESIPFSSDRTKHPKLATMLFIAHSAATAVNAGKIAFHKDPMAINYPQWIAFAYYSLRQLKWVLKDKPELRQKYIDQRLEIEFAQLLDSIDSTRAGFEDEYIFIME